MPKRKKTDPLCWHQHHGRNGSGLPATATTKKTNRNNNNNDDDCNTTNLINLQDVCSKQAKRVFVMPKRKKTGPLCWHQHHGRNGSGLPATATTKKTNPNNNNNDDDCNTTNSFDLQDEKHREIKKSMRFKTRMDKEKSNRLSTGSLTTRTTTMMMIVIRPI